MDNYLKNCFDTEKEIDKYNFDEITFDEVNIKKFHNTKFSTVITYMIILVMKVLAIILLAADVYTCLNILVFHHWSSQYYEPYANGIAKWIFTGCIIFQFLLLLYHWIWAIRAYRSKNIALAYVNGIARTLYSFRSYDYHCFFLEIEQDNFFDWACFLCYSELDGALQILLADTPRQVVNILTLRKYATDGNNSIPGNIRNIAETNLRLSIILSFMLLSVAIWCIFFFQFLLGVCMYIPVYVRIRRRGFKRLKRYCCAVVKETVRLLVLKYHKPMRDFEKESLDVKDIDNSYSSYSSSDGYEYMRLGDLPKPSAVYSNSLNNLRNDFTNPFDLEKSQTYQSLLPDKNKLFEYSINERPIKAQEAYARNQSSTSLANPFTDPIETDSILWDRYNGRPF